MENKLSGISLLRIVATISVIALHTAGTVTTAVPQLEDGMHTFFSSVITAFCWAVPVFFMITGSLLLNPQKELTASKCVKKYVLRMVLALFVFGIPFALLMLVFERRTFNPAMLIDSVIAVFTGDTFAHLWYLYVLVGIYLILPVLRGFVKNAAKKDIEIVLAALFLPDFILPTVSAYTGLSFEFSVPFTYPVFYLFAGYYIVKYKPAFLCHKSVNTAVVLLLTAAVFIMEYCSIPLHCFSYTGPLTAVMAAAIFSNFNVCAGSDNHSHSGLIWKVDRLCFGAYLIHPVFIQFAYRFLKITPASFEMYYIAIIPFFIVFTVCSFAVSWIMSLIKPLRKYVL